MQILETPRLIVRRWTAADADSLHSICSDPEVMRYVGDGAPWNRERTRQFIEDAVATEQTHGYCRWPLVAKDTGLLVGFCGFIPTEEGAEMGWRLASQFWGRGLANEAAQAVLKFGADSLGFRRITATVHCENRASLRVAEKLGMSVDTRKELSNRVVLSWKGNAR
ncbi:MAG TPA: GNAT family N-acetyltransferase [Pirellulales bacterium]|nr:GNAT family N-acetyltransferase [Pirellulales bacterium]